jgi:hemerythrin-like metal-binding protein
MGDSMHRFEMTPASSTGNPDIDGQIQILFDMANDLLFPDRPRRDLAEFKREVALLFSYIEYHFASEELGMLERSYSSRRFHSAFHDHVRRETQAINARLEQGASMDEICSAIFFVLEDWAVYHVTDSDRLLAMFLRESVPKGTEPRLPGIRPLKAHGALSADFDERILVGSA